MTEQQKKNNAAAPAENEEQIQIPLTDLIRIRYNKARQIEAEGMNPYPYKFDRTHTTAQVQEEFDQLFENETVVKLAGRLMLVRDMGKSIFADIHDSESRIQIYIKKDNVTEGEFKLCKSIDMGDIVGCEGTLFKTKTEEKTLRITKIELLSKSLHPLPDKHSGLQDVEVRYRRRYVDLIVNPDVRKTFIERTKIIQAVRDYLNKSGFLEVETPILQPLYGGGNAKPFETFHNKLDMKMYMRIADELYLKRLIIGGYDKVWEYCKDFRNEGLDRSHNPEFSMIELYWAYADYRYMAQFFEKMLREIVFSVKGKYKIEYDEHEIDFEPPFRWVSMIDSIKDACGIDLLPLSFEEAKKEAVKLGCEANDLINWGKCVEAIWEVKVEPYLIQPTFIVDYPADISPLAKKHRENDRLTERFELFAVGREVGNAFSELNDPIDQMKRFMQQGKALEAGDEEAQPLDDDFITALTYGMPPTAGLGFGIDRLVMLLTNQHTIRDVLFFPQMKDLKDGSVPVSKILAQIISDEK